MYVKGLFEVFKILGRLGIKPKDVIGMGGDVVKMGKSLFNTRINPKLLEFVKKNQKIPTKIIEDIKIHARTLKNATESQKNLFQANIKDLLNAKTPPKIQTTRGMGDLWPKQLEKVVEKVRKEFALKRFIDAAQKSKPPVASVKQPGSSNLSIAERMSKIKGLNKQLDKARKEYTEIYQPKVKDAAEAFKGWTPKVIKGGKDKLATGGRAGFDNGGIKLYPRASVIQSGETVGDNSDIDVDVRDVDYGITGLYEGNNWFAGAEMDKGNVKVDVTREGETLFKDSMGKDEVINFIAGFGDPNNEKFQIKVDDDFENVSIVLQKTFATGGIANHFRTR